MWLTCSAKSSCYELATSCLTNILLWQFNEKKYHYDKLRKLTATAIEKISL